MNSRATGSAAPAKPRVFIGSSSEGKEVAENLSIHLRDDCEPVLWHAGAFGVSETYIESLEKALQDVEFAVLVATPDDARNKRGTDSKIPRDNVIFELGLFMGKLARSRTFVVCDPKAGVALPTDLLGVNIAPFESNRSDNDLRQATIEAKSAIVHAIRKAPRRLSSEPAAKPFVSALLDEDAVYGAVVDLPVGEGDTIVIQTTDTRWAWDMVPTLVHWRMNGARVRVFAAPPGPVREEPARRVFLTELGVEVTETNDLSLSGFFLKTNYSEDDVAIVFNPPGASVPMATQYQGAADASAVVALHRSLRHFDDGTSPDSDFKPSLVAQDPQEILELLRRGVRQYRPPQVELQITSLPTNDLLLMTQYARAYKLTQIARLFHAYTANEHQPFASLAVRLRSGKKSILTPPVVEDGKHGRVVIEGTTRAAYCFGKAIETYQCIAVRGVEDDLPGTPVPIASVTASGRSLTVDERTENSRRLLFRHIERATHPY
jgi:hypothetical protein